MPLVKLIELKKTYHQGKIDVPALRGIDMEIESGEFTTVFGPSGSGKTTLLNMIGCLDKATSGEIYFDERLINDLDRKELAEIRRYNLGFVFQSYNLIPVLSAFENVEFAIRLIDKHNKKDRRDKVMEVLRDVGLEDMAGRKPNELSGGQKQRVAIARSLVNDPQIILADEPTGNLDSKTEKDILDILSRLNKKGITIVMVTHDRKVAHYAHRIAHFKDGKIIKEEKVEIEDRLGKDEISFGGEIGEVS